MKILLRSKMVAIRFANIAVLALLKVDSILRSNFITMYISFVGWKVVDLIRSIGKPRDFNAYGITVYAGRQGTGKTISMVLYLEQMKRLYPECLIVTNFKCSSTDVMMKSWSDFLTIRNGEKGVIFALDELQSEWNSLESKNFPIELLSEMCQQRKQRIKIVATTQVFGRMAKPLREQTYDVVACTTYFGRLTVNHTYDAYDFERMILSAPGISELKPLGTYRFIQTDALRSSYETSEKVQSMKRPVPAKVKNW